MLSNIVSYTKKSMVHHMTLFECSSLSYPGSDPATWDVWVKSNGGVCNSNLLTPRDWESCITPIASWAIGSAGNITNWSILFSNCVVFIPGTNKIVCTI